MVISFLITIFVKSYQSNGIRIMTPSQTQLHKNISFKGTMYKLSQALMAETIKFNAMVLRSKLSK